LGAQFLVPYNPRGFSIQHLLRDPNHRGLWGEASPVLRGLDRLSGGTRYLPALHQRFPFHQCKGGEECYEFEIRQTMQDFREGQEHQIKFNSNRTFSAFKSMRGEGIYIMGHRSSKLVRPLRISMTACTNQRINQNIIRSRNLNRCAKNEFIVFKTRL